MMTLVSKRQRGGPRDGGPSGIEPAVFRLTDEPAAVKSGVFQDATHHQNSNFGRKARPPDALASLLGSVAQHRPATGRAKPSWQQQVPSVA